MSAPRRRIVDVDDDDDDSPPVCAAAGRLLLTDSRGILPMDGVVGWIGDGGRVEYPLGADDIDDGLML